METFVVHIHRRPDTGGNARELAGIVERTDAAVSRPFGTLAELLLLLGLWRARNEAAPIRRHEVEGAAGVAISRGESR